ncbi:hypothetical protein HYALB_00004582 [Hymenoscyphus albidus]|uniref:cutinase n=1 Tax=Hymenoscyphus albidus TaxID=595503 RepID=A0A9N9M2X0_9HELO|nr:hypothetical protein HYALB_00004582 [Hymenoscyphus albidus]
MHRYLSILLGVFFFSQIVFSVPSPNGGTPFYDGNIADFESIVPGIEGRSDVSKRSIGDYSKGPMGVMPGDGTSMRKRGAALDAILALGSIILGDTQNMVVGALATGQTGACPSMAVFYARGTFEIGNVGIITGPPFFQALAAYKNDTNHIAIQGVDYPADVAGFKAGGSVDGANRMASLVNDTTSKCPNTQICLSGYSQGAQVVHLATTSLPSSTMSKISSIVLFGDPKNGTAIQGIDKGKVLTICHPGDNICAGGSKITRDHLSYGENAEAAAAFAVSGIAQMGISSQKMVRNKMGGLGAWVRF